MKELIKTLYWVQRQLLDESVQTSASSSKGWSDPLASALTFRARGDTIHVYRLYTEKRCKPFNILEKALSFHHDHKYDTCHHTKSVQGVGEQVNVQQNEGKLF